MDEKQMNKRRTPAKKSVIFRFSKLGSLIFSFCLLAKSLILELSSQHLIFLKFNFFAKDIPEIPSPRIKIDLSIMVILV